jgi:hypothetical protein
MAAVVDPSLVLDAGDFDSAGLEADSGMDVEVDPSLVLDAAGLADVVDPNVSTGALGDVSVQVLEIVWNDIVLWFAVNFRF